MAQEKASLTDIINYKPEDYFSPEEYALIQGVFNANPKLHGIMRKLLLPSVGDPELPVEQMGNDVWLSGRNYDQIPADECKIMVVARQDAIKFINGGLIKLKVICASPNITKEEQERRKNLDSTK